MRSRIIAILTKKDDIDNIISRFRNLNFDNIPKHKHFEFSIAEKLSDINLLKQTFSKFNLIKSVELRENEKGQKYYSLNYELEDKTFVVLVFILDSLMFINGFHAHRNYKKFEQSLRKNYSDKFI